MSTRQPPHERAQRAAGPRPARRRSTEPERRTGSRERGYSSGGRPPVRRPDEYGRGYPPREDGYPLPPRRQEPADWPEERSYPYRQRSEERWPYEDYEEAYQDDSWYPPQDRYDAPVDRGREQERYYDSEGRDYAASRHQDYSNQPRRKPPADRERTTLAVKKKPSRGRHVFLLLYNLFFYIVTIGILMGALLFAFSEKTTASILGYRFYSVLTNSMVPQEDSPPGGFYAGDIAIVKMMDGTQAEVGDILTFQVGSKGNYLTHRLTEKLEELNGEAGDYLITQGDANDSPDPPIEADRVIGKVVFAIPELGNAIKFVRDNLVMCLISIGSTFGLIIVLKAYFTTEEEPPLREGPSRNTPRNTPRRTAA